MLFAEECQKIVASVSSVYSYVSHEIIPYSNETIGFLGNHSKLIIKVKSSKNDSNNNTESQTTLNFFLKSLPACEKHLSYVNTLGLFRKEVIMYNTILPKLPIQPPKYYPKCLVATDSFLVLEDLKQKGFCMCDNFFNKFYWEAVLKSMASMHTASIIFECELSSQSDMFRKKKLNELYPDAVKEVSFSLIPGQPRNKWMHSCVKAIIQILHKSSEFNHVNITEIERKFNKFLSNKLKFYLEPSTKYKNAIIHADLWRNNILFRDVGTEIEAVFVDYQFTRYAPPAFDLLTALLLNSDAEFLENNFNVLLDVYYKYFSINLEAANLNPAEIMSYAEFLNSVEDYKIVGITEALFFGTIVFVGDELSKLIVSDDKIFEDFTLNDRSKYVVEEYVENLEFKKKIDGLLNLFVNCIEKLE